MRGDDVRQAAEQAEKLQNEKIDEAVREDPGPGLKLDPTNMSLEDWLRHHHQTRTGTFTFNGVTYTDMNEVEWRQANGAW